MSDVERLRPATGSDVAREAGVSQATVSLVMTGKTVGRISAERRDHVMRVARELGYQPNASARNLRLGRAHTVALIVPNVANPFFAAVLRGAERTARANRHAVMLLDTGNDPRWNDWVGTVLADRAVDGCIVYAADPVPDDLVQRLGRHVVLVEAAALGAGSVSLDIAGATRDAMTHLLDLGHRRIAHLAADYRMETFRVRAAAYRDALLAAGRRPERALIGRTTFDIERSTAMAKTLLERHPAPTAILCDDDLLAAGAYKAARALDLSIPGDVSIVGFDDIELARMLDPELTTVSIPAERVGMAAMEIMLELVGGAEPRTSAIPLVLQVRGSTAAPSSARARRVRRAPGPAPRGPSGSRPSGALR